MKKLESAKKFTKEHALSVTMFTAGTAALCASYILYKKVRSTNNAYLDGLAKGAGNVLIWAANKMPDANLPELWDAELMEALKKRGMEVSHF